MAAKQVAEIAGDPKTDAPKQREKRVLPPSSSSPPSPAADRPMSVPDYVWSRKRLNFDSNSNGYERASESEESEDSNVSLFDTKANAHKSMTSCEGWELCCSQVGCEERREAE